MVLLIEIQNLHNIINSIVNIIRLRRNMIKYMNMLMNYIKFLLIKSNGANIIVCMLIHIIIMDLRILKKNNMKMLEIIQKKHYYMLIKFMGKIRYSVLNIILELLGTIQYSMNHKLLKLTQRLPNRHLKHKSLLLILFCMVIH